MEKLKRVSKAVDTAVGYVGMVFFIVLIIACVMQVFFRFVMNHSLSWTEETARYCFIWMHMIGASLLIQDGGHATVTVILDALHGPVRKAVDALIALIIIFNGAIMTYSGAMLAYSSRANLSTALRIPMWIINISVAVGGVLIVFAGIMRLLIVLTREENKEGKEEEK